MDSGKSTFDWAGKILQLAQTILLIVTFWLGLVERQTNREDDRFSKLVFEFATDQAEALYAKTQTILDSFEEEFDKAFEVGAPDEGIRGAAVAKFQKALYHVRSRVVSRCSCYSIVPLQSVEEVFTDMEDGFAEEIRIWGSGIPIRNLAFVVADGSTRLIKLLLEAQSRVCEMPLRNSLLTRMRLGIDRWLDGA